MVIRDFIKISISFCFLVLSQSNLFAQKQLNFGLTRKQPVSTLPKGKAAFQKSIEKQRSNVVGSLNPLGNGYYTINQGWELTDDMSLLLGNEKVFSESINTKDGAMQ